jgi:hypothetical protein
MSEPSIFGYVDPLKEFLKENVPLCNGRVIVIADYERIDESFETLPQLAIVPLGELQFPGVDARKQAEAGCNNKWLVGLMVVAAVRNERDQLEGFEALKALDALVTQLADQMKVFNTQRPDGFKEFVRQPINEIFHHNGVAASPVLYQSSYIRA